MRKLVLASVLLFTAVPLFADDGEKVLKEWAGQYELVSMMEGGKPATDEQKKEISSIEIRGNELIISTGRGEHSATLKLDPAQKPANVELTTKKDNKRHSGIYKFEKGELTMVFAKEGERPTDFDAQGDSIIKLVLKKKEPKKDK